MHSGATYDNKIIYLFFPFDVAVNDVTRLIRKKNFFLLIQVANKTPSTTKTIRNPKKDLNVKYYVASITKQGEEINEINYIIV